MTSTSPRASCLAVYPDRQKRVYKVTRRDDFPSNLFPYFEQSYHQKKDRNSAHFEAELRIFVQKLHQTDILIWRFDDLLSSISRILKPDDYKIPHMVAY